MNDRSILTVSTGKRQQVVERGVAGPEIVDRQVDAEALGASPERLDGGVAFLGERRSR